MNLKLKEKFLTDENGKKEAVVLDVRTYEELIEDLEDLVVIADRKSEEAVPLDAVKRKLKKDGIL